MWRSTLVLTGLKIAFIAEIQIVAFQSDEPVAKVFFVIFGNLVSKDNIRFDP